MLCSNKINPAQLGVIASLFSLVGSILVFVLALTVLNEQNTKQSSNKDVLGQQIQNLQEQLLLLQRKL